MRSEKDRIRSRKDRNGQQRLQVVLSQIKSAKGKSVDIYVEEVEESTSPIELAAFISEWPRAHLEIYLRRGDLNDMRLKLVSGRQELKLGKGSCLSPKARHLVKKFDHNVWGTAREISKQLSALLVMEVVLFRQSGPLHYFDIERAVFRPKRRWQFWKREAAYQVV